MLILTVLTFVALVMTTSISPVRSDVSRFELKRRSEGGDKESAKALERESSIGDIESLLHAISALLLVVFVLLSVTTLGWLIGGIVAVVVALEYGAIARLNIIKKWSNSLYQRIEDSMLRLTKKAPYLFTVLRSVPQPEGDNGRIDSREELQHLVDESIGVLSADEKKLITHSLSFGEKLVSSIMTPRSVINSIKKSEFLGPLTLDELHRTGHSRLPVIDGDIDHVVGILHLKNLLTLDIKRSTTAEKAMDPKVYYVRDDQTLQHALAAFLRTRHHLFVVVNEYRETVGLLALEDVIETLIGRKIIDEFDAHEDLRAVALHNPNDNNEPKKGENI